MNDNCPAFHQDYTVRTPIAQEVLPVTIADWNRYKRRIKQLSKPTGPLETFGSTAIGSGLSFLVVALTFPFSVDWSKMVGNVEHICWMSWVMETAVGFLGLFLLGCGIIALRFAREKKGMQADFADLLVEDMEDFEARHASSQL